MITLFFESKMALLYNRSQWIERRKILRNNMVNAEVVLWSRLRNRQLGGFKFRRQYGVGPFVVDFYCAKPRLAIEVDGDSHFASGAEAYDKRRQQYIESFGIHFLRVTNQDVFNNLDEVLWRILEVVSEGRVK